MGTSYLLAKCGIDLRPDFEEIFAGREGIRRFFTDYQDPLIQIWEESHGTRLNFIGSYQEGHMYQIQIVLSGEKTQDGKIELVSNHIRLPSSGELRESTLNMWKMLIRESDTVLGASSELSIGMGSQDHQKLLEIFKDYPVATSTLKRSVPVSATGSAIMVREGNVETDVRIVWQGPHEKSRVEYIFKKNTLLLIDESTSQPVTEEMNLDPDIQTLIYPILDNLLPAVFLDLPDPNSRMA